MKYTIYSLAIMGIWIFIGGSCLRTDTTACGDARCPAGRECMSLDGKLACVEPGQCGDGALQASRNEVCDDGNTADGDGCSADCRRLELCGNGVIDKQGEVCDDGNTIDGDGCSADCRSDETCGNGIVDAVTGEDCDCGEEGIAPGGECQGRNNSITGGLCQPDCTRHCGDGVVAAEEACDGLPTQHCADFGFDFGHLDCNASCSGLAFDDCGYLGWRTTSTPTLSDLDGVWGSGPDDVFAVGPQGAIFHHDGATWTAMESRTLFSLRGIWGSAPDDVFAVGVYGTILHYDGRTWTPMQSRTYSTLNAVWGSAPDHIFAVGDYGTILHYDGDEWTPVNTGIANSHHGIWGSGPDHIVVVGNYGLSGKIIQYDGATWTDSGFTAPAALRGVWGSGEDHVIAAGDNGTIAQFENGVWTRTSAGTPVTFHALWGSARDDVFAVGDSGAIAHHDGVAWTALESGTALSLHGAWGSAKDDVYAVGADGTVVHHYGSSFTAVEPGTALRLQGVWSSGPEQVVAVGAGGVIVEHDGTTPTTTTTLPATPWLYGVWGSAPDDVFAVGERGTIAHYDGAGWTSVELDPATTFSSVWGTRSDHVIAVSDTGTIWSGPSWTRTDSNPSNPLYGVWGSSTDTMFAVGDQGTILHGTGAGWEDRSSATSAPLRGVWGSGPDDVFAVGDDSTILHYQGSEWTSMAWTGNPAHFTAVAGSGPSDVLAVGQGSSTFVVAHYNGIRWTPMVFPQTTFKVTGLWQQAGGRTTYFVGDQGMIYKLVRNRGGVTSSAGPDLGLDIPDDGYDGSLARMACATVTAPAAPVADVMVELGVTHARASDLTLKIASPMGTVSTLVSRPGYAEAADNGQGTGGISAALVATSPIRFFTAGARDAETMGAAGGVICQDDGQCDYAPDPGAGPGTGLADFGHENAAGQWRICAGDSVPGGTGTIESVALTIQAGGTQGVLLCGNSKVEYGEQCDDGNRLAGDGCDESCQREPVCGDARIEAPEQCDDGNASAGDGCDDRCRLAATMEIEPNDDGTPEAGQDDFDPSFANGPHDSDTIISATLVPAGDDDVFAVSNNSAAEVTVRFDIYHAVWGIEVSCSTAIDTVLNLRDGTGAMLGMNDDRDYSDRCSGLEYTIPPGQTIYAQVQAYGDSTAIPSPGYLLVIDFP